MILEHSWSRWNWNLSLREHIMHYKGRVPCISVLMTLLSLMKKSTTSTLEVGLKSEDKNVRSTKVVIGKIKNTVTRLITCLYPVEFCEEFSPTVKNEVERRRSKTGRNTAVIVHLKKNIINARRVSVKEVTCHSIWWATYHVIPL